jgi:chromosome segregation ATPase
MHSLTGNQVKLLELQHIQFRLQTQKSELMRSKTELEKQLRQLQQKEAELNKLLAQAAQKELQLLQQVEEVEEEQQPIPQPSPELQKELLSLLRGDAIAALRLLKSQQERNPGRSADWCLEKVIWDLKRDRY